MEIEFISSNVIGKEKDKVAFILDTVKKDKLLVFQYALSYDEESKLIEETMKRISGKFSGIEVSTLRNEGIEEWKAKVLDILGIRTNGLTIVGPSSMVKSIKKNPDMVKMLLGDEDNARVR